MVEEKFDLAKAIDDYLNEKEDKPRERSYFYASEVGKSRREIYNSFKNPTTSKFDARVKRILDNGNYVHSRIYKYLIEMGLMIAAEIKAVENELFHGRADAIITDKKKNIYVLDIKSCSMWVFNKLTEPQFSDKLQVLLYCYYMNIPKGIVLYENKDNQSIKDRKSVG